MHKLTFRWWQLKRKGRAWAACHPVLMAIAEFLVFFGLVLTIVILAIASY